MKKWRLKKIATVHCNGGSHAKKIFDYDEDVTDCQMALEVNPDGNYECKNACLGLGSCVKACKFDAIHINEFGVAEVDTEKCIGCKICIRNCPRDLMTVRDYDLTVTALCSNEDKGAVSRKICDLSCIACKICEKFCPADAIVVTNNHAIINNDLCLNCGMCITKCPRKLIVDQENIVLY